MAVKAQQELTSRAINGMFRKGLTNAGMPAYIDMGCWHNPDANQFTEEYLMLDRVASFRKWVGERQAKSLSATGFICESEEFENTLSVKPRERRLDKTGQLQMAIDSMMARAPQLHARLFMNLVTKGHDSVAQYGANYTYDGADFFGNGHRDGQDNDITAAAADPSKPEVEEVSDALVGVLEKMRGYTDEAGEPENEDASQFLILGPTSMSGRFTAALGHQTIQGSGGAIDNVLPMMDATWRQMTTQRLDADFGGAAKSFVVLRTDHTMKPFVRQTEKTIAPMAPLAEGSEYARLNRDSWLLARTGSLATASGCGSTPSR